MPQKSSKSAAEMQEDIQKIKEWMSKQPHLSGNLDEQVLARFLHSCYYGLEDTKRCIEKFYTIRSDTPELFTNRDPLCKKIQTQVDISYFCSTMSKSGKRMYTFWQLNDPNLSSYIFFDNLKMFFMQADCWLLEDRNLEEEDVVVVDMKGIPAKIITMVNLSVLRKSFVYLLEALPTRLTEIHAINCPPFMDRLFGIVKPFLPPEICQIIHFHQPESQLLYDYVEKDMIPVELGGTGPKAQDLMNNWNSLMKKHRDFYLNDSVWVADDNRRPKKQYADEVDLMKGSFRALCVD